MKTLREIWTSMGLTQEEVAVKADVSMRSVYRANHGMHMSVRHLRRVCEALGITLDEYKAMYAKDEGSSPIPE